MKKIINKNIKLFECHAAFDIKYSIFLSNDVFNPENNSLLYGRKYPEGKAFLVIDKNIMEAYIDKIHHFYDHHKIKFEAFSFSGGEENKSVEIYLDITRHLNDFQVNRRSEPLIVIGGGVASDVAAFVSSTFRRGVPHIKIPTTLMGYVDASIGIKNGLNFENNKNRIGSFYPPIAVFLDPQFLSTLSDRHIANGLGEVIKIAVIKNSSLFAILEEKGRSCLEQKFQGCGLEILELAIQGLLVELQKNFYELELERVVDFGHTFSPALEMKDKNLLHGEAVAIDVVFSSFLAEHMRIFNFDDVIRVVELVDKIGLPVYSPELNVSLLWEGVKERTYHRDGKQRIPLPKGIGECLFFNDITLEDIQAGFTAYKNFISTFARVGSSQNRA